ncbi:MAG: hypothetical protein LBQ24_06425 [Candidatus Peribacteria bacterium]|nr:hypothetical protein [Candidatus Peribacteria bacterium]
MDNLALDKRITTLKTIIDNVDKLSTLNKQLVEKFTVSYLRYLIVESLNTAEKELENEKNIEKEDTTKEEEKIEVPSLFPDRELNQTLFLA